MDCIFCKIIKGEIPCQKIYENDTVISFLDIFPINYGHTLVVPKKHHQTLLDVPDEEMKDTITAIKKISRALIKGLKADGFNLFQNNGESAGQEVPHAHFHILPRFKDDGIKFNMPKREYTKDQINEIAKKITECL